jgi:hypothetical protein
MKTTYTIDQIIVNNHYIHQIFGHVMIVAKVDWPEYPDGVWKVYSFSQRREFYAFNVKYFE